MDGLAAFKTRAPDAAARPFPAVEPPSAPEHGVAPGINIEPGHNDDGWEIPPPVRLDGGTMLQLYKDGEALHAAYEAIQQAKWRICFEVYIFHSDETGWAFADLLSKKSRDGLSVYLIYDAFGCMGSDDAMFRQMRRAGVRLAEFHPIWPWQCQFSWRPVLRDHRKLLITDDEFGWLGGMNVGGEYAGSWVVRSKRRDCPWRDNGLGLRGRAARLLMPAFARTWRYIHHGGPVSTAGLIHNLFEGDLGILASTPTRSSPLANSLKRLVRQARRSIQITMSYFAPPDDFIDELVRAAKRGVRVQLMLPGLCDVPILVTAARSFYATLLEAGIEVYERQGAILHAKSLCIDGYTTILGSINLDYRAIEQNLELSVFIRSHELGQQMHVLFDNDVRFARQISLAQWRRRPTLDRIGQWAVKRARYLL